MLDAMKSLRDEMLALKTGRRWIRPPTLIKIKACLVLPIGPLNLSNRIHRKFSRWTRSPMAPLFLQDLQKSLNLSVVSTRIATWNTWIKLPILNIIRLDQNIKNMLTGRNTSQNASTINLVRLQMKISPLPPLEGLLNLSKRFLQDLSLRPAQTQSLSGS